MQDTAIQHKVVLRIVVGDNGFLAELNCRGHDRRFSGPRGRSLEETARAALASALGALKAPCALECYIDEACAPALEGVDRLSPFEHYLQPYFLAPSDDPALKALHQDLCAMTTASAA